MSSAHVLHQRWLPLKARFLLLSRKGKVGLHQHAPGFSQEDQDKYFRFLPSSF